MQKITPHLWFDNQAEEAMNFYVSLFENSRITRLDRIPGGPAQGNVMGAFELAGQAFMAIDGGSYFTFTPAISLVVTCDTQEEVDRLWERLVEGGTVLMPLAAYPFSEKFGWLNDKYGLSWQVSLGSRQQKITPSLLFVGEQHGQAEEAMNFYTGLFPDSRISNVVRYGPGEGETEGTVKHAVFELHGQEFTAMDSGLAHAFTFSGATSFLVSCETQAEIDHYWEKLSDGGQIQQCGWLTDRFGVTWQIVPAILGELLNSSEPAKAKRVMNALLRMIKLDIEALKNA